MDISLWCLYILKWHLYLQMSFVDGSVCLDKQQQSVSSTFFWRMFGHCTLISLFFPSCTAAVIKKPEGSTVIQYMLICEWIWLCLFSVFWICFVYKHNNGANNIKSCSTKLLWYVCDITWLANFTALQQHIVLSWNQALSFLWGNWGHVLLHFFCEFGSFRNLGGVHNS